MNAAELAMRLNDAAESIAEHLLPQGKRAGAEWKAGSVGGEPGQSLSVRLTGSKRGVWKDFASGEGGDMLDLWAACRSMSMAEAITDAKSYLGIRDDLPKQPQRAWTRPEKPPCQKPKGKVATWFEGRGLTPGTVQAFQIGEQLRGGKAYAVFPYFRDEQLVNAKYRNVEEKRDMRQERDAEPCLFGWHLIDPKARSIVITEGEIDAMTFHQAGLPALSVNAGAGNHQWIENDWDRLERFSDIVVCFDDDDAGRKGAREVVQRLGVERCRVATLGAKDANQWLIDGATDDDFRCAIADAKVQDPEEMVQFADFMEQVKAKLYPTGDSPRLPVLRLGHRDYEWFECRGGEYSVWTGINGHGKSLALSQVLLGFAEQGERCMVFSGEMPAATQLLRMTKQAAGLARPSPAYLDAIADWIRDKFWVFNRLGSAGLDDLLRIFEYANRRYGVRQFVIDSLMMTDVPEDGNGAITKQKQAVQKIADFVKRTNSHLHLVAHPRKQPDESKNVGKMDVAGSSKITDAADNVWSIWSARKPEDEEADDKPDALFELQKQRNGEVQHKKLWLFFNKGAQQYCPSSDRRAVALVDFRGPPVPHAPYAALSPDHDQVDPAPMAA